MPFDNTKMLRRISSIPHMMPCKVLIKEIPHEKAENIIETVERSSIVRTYRPESMWGEVIAVGGGKRFGKQFLKPECKPGDIVAFNPMFDQMQLYIGDSEDVYYIYDYGDILLIYEK